MQPFAVLYVLIPAGASPLLAKEPEQIYGPFTKLSCRLSTKRKAPDEEVE